MLDRFRMTCVVAMGWLAAAAMGQAKLPLDAPVGGANSPPPKPPHKLIIDTAELSAGAFSVKVPTGSYTAPAGGAPNYSVPGPIVAFKGADGVWRGHGYLETYPRLLKFTGKVEAAAAELDYQFEEGKSYQVKLQAKDGALLMEETSNLGPRNIYVFDCFYGDWFPTAGFATDLSGAKHNFLYLPCYYDKPEVTINPQAQPAPAPAEKADAPAPKSPAEPVKAGGVAVLNADPASKDVAGFWCRDPASWRNGDTMGIQLWQHRQLGGDPGSRHFLGPETKSDSTPNPRTAALMGQSLYEGHVTIELNLGTGTRKLGFAATSKGPDKNSIPLAFQKLIGANQK